MNDETQPLLKHLMDLRARLVWVIVIMVAGMGVSYMFIDHMYAYLVQPLASAMGEGDSRRLIYTGLTEAFFTSLKISFFAGIFITFPLLLWQVWLFVAPGLYQKERKSFFAFMVATPLLFYMGGACVYYLVLPMAWPFFLGFQTTGTETALPIQLEARVSEYLDLIMTLIFAFGVCFELPVFMTLLGKAGLVTPEGLASTRRFAIVLIFIIAAVLTPPDIMSQTLLALPLLALYEISILLVRHVQKPAKPL